MGIFWSCSACRRYPEPEPATRAGEAEADPVINLDSDEEASNGSLRRYLIDGDSSFLGSNNLSGNSWFSMVTTNLTSWISQASGAVAAIWDNNPGEGYEFLAEMADDTLPDVGTATIDSKLRAFTFNEMKAATFNFRRKMVLGMGGFGTVYKGWFKAKGPSQVIRKRAIAIKKLDKFSKQGFRQWRTEVGFLGKLSHPNIIKLLGYCRENDELLIVYDFMPKGSLNYHLFGKRSISSTLPWDVRVKIVVGMAQGLCHLHTMEKPIIYRDFKSSNILLDERNLVNYVETRLVNKRKLKGIMDEKLEGEYSIKEAYAIAARCLNEITEHRPSMKEVVETLQVLESRYQKPVE